MRLDSLTDPALIFPGLQCPDAASLLRLLAQKIVARGLSKDAEELYRKLWEREQLGTTAVGSGVAVPHCKLSGLERVVLAVALLNEGIDFGAEDEEPVRVFFCIVSPHDSPAAHLQCLAAVSRWVKEAEHVERLLELTEPEAICRLFSDSEDGG